MFERIGLVFLFSFLFLACGDAEILHIEETSGPRTVLKLSAFQIPMPGPVDRPLFEGRLVLDEGSSAQIFIETVSALGLDQGLWVDLDGAIDFAIWTETEEGGSP